MTENSLLARIPTALRLRLNTFLEPIALEAGCALFDVGDVIQYGYFPTSGLVSLVGLTSDGGTVELATIAREGVIGLPALLHSAAASYQAVVRVSGHALRFSVRLMRSEIDEHAVFRSVLLDYANRASTEIAQAVICQCFHTVVERCCRWLLVASDRTGLDTLQLTHEGLAQALGVARPVVTRTAIELMDAGAIRYRHGRLTIVDRTKLERLACECYGSGVMAK